MALLRAWAEEILGMVRADESAYESAESENAYGGLEDWPEQAVKLFHRRSLACPSQTLQHFLNKVQAPSNSGAIPYVLQWLENRKRAGKKHLPRWLAFYIILWKEPDLDAALGSFAGSTLRVKESHLQTFWASRSKRQEQLKSVETLLQGMFEHCRAEMRRAPDALEQDFIRPYLGTAPETLHQVLSAYDRRSEKPAIYPLIQSSGVGKSRTVVELSSFAPGVMFCLGPAPDLGRVTSLPPQDRPVYDFLTSWQGTGAGEYEEPACWYLHCTAAALLEATTQVFLERTTEALAQHYDNPTGDPWQYIVDQLAYDFNDGIVTGWHPTPRSSPPSPSERSIPKAGPESPNTSHRDELINRIMELTKAIWEQSILSGGRLYRIPNRPASAMARLELNIARIKANLGESGQSSRYFFLALDNCDTVRSLLPPLNCIMSHLTACPLRLLLLDTNSSLAHVSSSEEEYGRRIVPRLMTGEKRMCDPHMIISHDAGLFSTHKQRYYDFFNGEGRFQTHAEALNWVKLMGRPLWGDSSYESAGDHSVAGVSLKKVLTKMQCWLEPGEDQILALAAARLPLTIVGLAGATHTADFVHGQIARHLRCIIGFDNTGHICYTNVFSEPIMSLAAAWMQRKYFDVPWKLRSVDEQLVAPFGYWDAAIQVIRSKQVTRAVIIGDNGEEYFRLIFTMAIDAEASLSKAHTAQPDLPAQLNLVRLDGFLSRLYGSVAFPDKWQRLVQRCWIDVTHLMKIERQDNSAKLMHSRHLLQMFSRRAAGIEITDQDYWNIVVPLCEAGEERPLPSDELQPRQMLNMVIHVKVDPESAINDYTSKGFSEPIEDDPNIPSLCLFFNLASECKNHVTETGNQLVVHLGGRGEDRFPVLNSLSDEGTRDALIGLLGKAGSYQPKDTLRDCFLNQEEYMWEPEDM